MSPPRRQLLLCPIGSPEADLFWNKLSKGILGGPSAVGTEPPLGAEIAESCCPIELPQVDGYGVRLTVEKGPPLGEGSFATVVRGTLVIKRGAQDGTHRDRDRSVSVALKKFRPIPAQGQLRGRVLEELRLLHRARHSSRVVRLLAAQMPDGDPPVLVLEFMAGGALSRHIQKRSPFLEWGKSGKRIMLDVSEGLLFLHTRRPIVVHRDLRSANVLLTASHRAKIADLGLAKHQDRSVLPSLSVLFNQHAAFPPESVAWVDGPEAQLMKRSCKWDVWQARARFLGPSRTLEGTIPRVCANSALALSAPSAAHV